VPTHCCLHTPQYLLTNRFGFSPSQIVVLRDDDHSKGRDFVPFRDVILRACSWLVADAKPGNSLFFHYSGHGSRMKDPTCEQTTSRAGGRGREGTCTMGSLEKAL
jgi:hypothetical protein